MTIERRPSNQIITTDPGVDDAVAILVSWGLYDNPAYVATYGNGSIEQTFTNLSTLATSMERYKRNPARAQPVTFAGTLYPPGKNGFTLEEKYNGSLDFIHGKNAMEGFTISALPVKPDQESHVLYDRAADKESKTDLIALGALTEVHQQLNNANLRPHIGSVTLMGGAFREAGNVEPHQEANFRHDPLALREIIRITSESNIPLTIVPLDISHHPDLECTPERLDRLMTSLRERGAYTIAEVIHTLTGPDAAYFKFYTGQNHGRYDQQLPQSPRTFIGPPIHDLTAIMVARYPELFIIAEKQVKVTAEGPEAGAIGEAQNHMSPDGKARVVIGLSHEGAADLYWNKVADALAVTYR